MRLLSRTLLTALATVAALTVVPGVSTPSPAAAATSWELQGRGWGHGIGMSQYGALGAADKGLGYRRILGFYYPGTTVGTAKGSIRVLVTAERRNTLTVANRTGLTVRSTATGTSYALKRAGATRWRILPSADNATSRVYVLVAGRWVLVRQIRGGAEFIAPSLRLYLPTGSKVLRGRLRSVIVDGQRDVVNILPLEYYVRGVVPLEMPASWHRQAVRSQAVAARTYAAFERASRASSYFDVYDTTRSQVYGGLSAEDPRSTAAVSDTAGEVRLYAGKPAFTQFSSSNGGWTVASSNADMPYLKAQADPYDPIRTWHWTLTQAELNKALPGIGTVTSVTVTQRDGNGAGGGRVTLLKVTGTGGIRTITGSDLRSAIGLLSTYFWIQ